MSRTQTPLAPQIKRRSHSISGVTDGSVASSGQLQGLSTDPRFSPSGAEIATPAAHSARPLVQAPTGSSTRSVPAKPVAGGLAPRRPERAQRPKSRSASADHAEPYNPYSV